MHRMIPDKDIGKPSEMHLNLKSRKISASISEVEYFHIVYTERDSATAAPCANFKTIN